MAKILPPTSPPPDDPVLAHLQATLAGLPDGWIVLPGRRIGDVGPSVGFIVIHGKIGVALVDLAPAAPANATGPLRALLDSEGIPLDGNLPIVAVAVPPDEIRKTGSHVAAAFEAAPPCRTADRGWADRIVDLLPAMAPGPTLRALSAREDIAVEPLGRRITLTAEEPLALSAASPSRRSSVVTVLALVAGTGLVAAGVIALRPPATDTAPRSIAALTPPSPSLSAPAASPASAEEPAGLSAPPAPDPAAQEPVAFPAPTPAIEAPATSIAAAPSNPEPVSAPPLPTPKPAPRRPVQAAADTPWKKQVFKHGPDSVPHVKPVQPDANTVAALTPPAKPARTAAFGSSTPVANGPPIDAGQLPPLDPATPVPTGASVPLRETPDIPSASAQPVMLLPPAAPPADRPTSDGTPTEGR